MADTSPNLAPSDITPGEFKTGYWLYKHHDLFKTIVIWFLIVVSVTLWGYAAVKFVGYLATSKAHEQMLVSLTGNNLDTAAIHEKNKAQEVEVISVQPVPMGTNYDLVALVRNPNLQWSAGKVAFSFEVGGQVVGSGEDFILPLGEKYFFVSNVNLPADMADLTLTINSTEWQRIKNFKDFPITDFTVSAQKLDNLAEPGNKQTGARLTFDLTNNSAYSFWQVSVVAALKSGASVVALARRPVDNFTSGQTQSVTFFWDIDPSNATNVEVKTEVNVLDKTVFKD